MKDEEKVKEQPISDTQGKKGFPTWTIWIGAFFVLTVLAISSYFLITHKPAGLTGNVEKLTLGISESLLSIPVYIAQKQGYFEREGLDLTVKEYSSGKMATVSMLNGEIDISTVADMPIVLNSFIRQDFYIVAAFTSSYSFVKIITRKDKGIEKGEDLKGKKVGTNRGTSGHFFLGVFLIHNGLSISEVEMIDIRTVALPAALENNEVDAISVWEPYAQETRQLLQDNAAELQSSDIYRATFNFAALRSFAENNTEAIKKFLKAIDKTAAFIQNNREESQKIIADNFKLDIEIVDMVWDDYVFELFLDQSLLISWDDIARWTIENKLTDKKEIPNYLNFIYPDALEAVKPESVTIIH